MELQALNATSLEQIYNIHMVEDFPKDELKPLSMLQEQMARGNCLGWELVEEGQLLAYAIFAKAKQPSSPVLLDYYAVNAATRGRGIGSICLPLLAQELAETDFILLEVEATEKAQNEKERQIRERRISFYKQNGCVETGIDNFLFGVDFMVMALPCRKIPSDDEVYTALEDIYQTMMPPERYQQQVRLTRR